MTIAKFLNGYIQFIKINNMLRVHIHFRNLIPTTPYIFCIYGFCKQYELCYLKSNHKGQIHSIFYDENMNYINKKLNMYENNKLIESVTIIY